jgi:hypothetical protein
MQSEPFFAAMLAADLVEEICTHFRRELRPRVEAQKTFNREFFDMLSERIATLRIDADDRAQDGQ